MMRNYEKGSEWRKWDLHIHTPQTKLNNNYRVVNEQDVWDYFCEKIELSDVSIFGITDYFSIDNYNAFLQKFNKKYPASKKVFFPNIEFRTDSKNSNSDHIQCHVLFSNQEDTVKKIANFLTRLSLVSTDINLTSKHCTNDNLLEVTFEKAMVTIDKLTERLLESFGKDEYIIVGVSNGYGTFRPGRNDGRGAEYAKELDKKCHAFFGVKTNVDFYLNKTEDRAKFDLPPKPVLYGSDCHSFDDIEEKLGQFFTWIKADPTFKGLRQTLYEPESRVKIQENEPDEKRGYQVIDTIEINDENIKQTIQFNPNLNTIIGGRSTGKSSLLQVLALTIDSGIIEFKQDKSNEKNFIKSIVSNAIVKWKDDEKDKKRDIEFFPQNHMHDIARNNGQKDGLIQGIIKNTDEQKKINTYHAFCTTNKETIQSAIDNLFKLQDSINNNNISLKEKGDKEGLEIEIKGINNAISKIKIDDNFSDDDVIEFKKIRKYIVEAKQYIKILNNDKTQILSLKNEQLLNYSIPYKFNELSDYSKPKIDVIFTKLSKDTIELWKIELDKKLMEIDTEIKTHRQRINTHEQQQSFKKWQEYISGNKQYSELLAKLKIEQEKLQEIKIIEEQTQALLKQQDTLFNEILDKHVDYLKQITALKNDFALEYEDIEIKIYSQFLEKKCTELLKGFINLQSHDRQRYVDQFSENYSGNVKGTIQGFLSKALNGEFELKNHKDIKDLTKGMLIENWFSLSYELTYQNDSFNEMSDGKKAFVILKLLLDFSNKKCPILIDQPEDSLDNRAIYNELVAYIKSKKTQRQIILVTHNANVVVNADAEEVIVANQHGKDSKNKGNIKFQYISGSLENTKLKNIQQSVVLNSQGIKEHTCEILEGGTEAFKKRENKYGI
nr:hypothetical protein [bacterium endosymbiont of Bathymodiolus sp. 5 South]